MKYVYGLIAITICVTWFAYMNELHAGEWNEKPVMCEQKASSLRGNTCQR